jgi:DHA1 family bicyclomycin/chloramphenicol resistance-like MFS transporter
MLASLSLFGLGSILIALAWNIESFLFFRFIQAVGAGGISVISISVLSDMFTGAVFARYMATYSMGFPIMLAVAPVIGAHLFECFGWQANFWFLAIIAFGLCVCFYLGLPETHQGHKDTLSWKHLGRNIKKLSSNKHFLSLATGHGLPVAIVAIFSANSSFLFIDSFGFSSTVYAYIQLIPVAFNLWGSLVFRQVVTPWGLPKSLRMGLYASATFLLLASVGVFWGPLQLPIPVIIVMCVINFSLSACISACGTMALEYDQNQRGLAVAVLGMFRSGVVAALVLLVGVFFDGTVVPVYLGMGISTAILLIVAWPYANEKLS